MKSSSQSPRIPARLSESIYRRLNMYTVAATAAGVGVLALAPRAEAEVVYHRIHQVIGEASLYQLDLNGGTTDFTIDNSARNRTSASIHSLFIAGASGNAVEVSSKGLFAAPLKAGTRIPNTGKFAGTKKMAFQCLGFTSCGTGSTITSGAWVNVASRYLGLKFLINGSVHYGWARLSVQVSRSQFTVTATLTGYAYETVPGKPIIAGNIVGQESDKSVGSPKHASLATPYNPATLGLLALGSPGLSIWRRQQQVGTAR